MTINADCTYDLNSIEAFHRMNMFGKVNPIKRMKLFGIIDLILAFLLIIELIAFGNNIFLWILLCVLFVSTVVYCFMFFVFPKMQYKSAMKFANIHNKFVFSDDEFFVSSDTQEYSGNSRIKYSMLYKAVETNAYYFLFQNKISAFIVDKSNINENERTVLSQLLRNSVSKYIRCKY